MDDLISKQQAIELIKNYCENGCDIAEDNWCPSCQREQFIKLLKALPSVQPEPTDIDAREAVYNLAEKIGIHQLFALTVELRGEPIQPEPAYEQVEEYCKRRCLHIVTADFFESTKPQRLGHWIQYDKRFPWRHHYKCSECGNYLDFTGVNGGRGEVNYCPNCGAKMKGAKHETD